MFCRMAGWWMVAVLCMVGIVRAGEQDPNRTDGYKGPAKGTFTGTVVSATDGGRLTVATKNGESRVFVPHWRGGNDGGFDKAMVEQIRQLHPGDTVTVTWEADERFRVTGLRVVKRAAGEERKAEERKAETGQSTTAASGSQDPNRTDNYKGPKNGTFTGTVIETTDGGRLTVTTKNGESRVFVPYWRGGNDGGFDKAMVEQIRKLRPGDTVTVTWVADERFRVTDLH